MRSKLRHKKPRVSFFAFQDMITTVTGVLLLVTLMLTIYLNQPAATADQSHRDAVKDQLDALRRELTAKAEALRQRQIELMALTNRVFVIPEADRSGKTPVLIVLSATNGWYTRLGQTNAIEFPLISEDGVSPADDPGSARAPAVAVTNKIESLLAQWNPAHERLVFYVRPSSIPNFEAFKEIARQRGFNIGYDAAEEQRHYVLAAP